MSEVIVIVSILTFAALLILLHNTLAKGRVHLPPGPKPSFLSGNFHQLPQVLPWLTYESWSKLYGPLVYFRIFGTGILVLNTAQVALDLLESRSAIYSDRPTSWMMGVLVGRRWSVFMIPFQNPRFKIYRKILHSGLNPRAVQNYQPIQLQETRILLNLLAQRPEDFVAHIRRNATAVILKVAYGYQVESNDDQFVHIIEEGFSFSARVSVPGMYLVESFPILRFVPDWFPGAEFKRLAKRISKVLARIEQVPFDWAKNKIASGDYTESFTSNHLYQDEKQGEEHEDIIKWCSAALYAGGADTTVSALTTFFLLMSLYPEVQKQAQLEIQQVIGDRLPTLDDQKAMPYISALVKEVIRWGPVAPLGLRHLVMEDDTYNGYFIPKGTTVMANIWAITHDPTLYPNPFIFDPSRHLGDKPQVDPFKFVFGFGRRVCPGAHLAESSLFLNISNILAVFNITKELDKDGNEIEPTIGWSTGVTSHLNRFGCRIEPRSKATLETLNL